MSLKHSYEYVYNYFKEHGCVLLETEYINAHTKMNYICKCGRHEVIRFNSFKNGSVCKECAKKSMIQKRTLKIEHVREVLETNGWELLDKTYVNNTTKLLALCPIKHEVYITIANFKRGRRCKKCQIESLTGENHVKWIKDRSKIEITERLRQKKTSSWILNNLKNDKNYNIYKEHLYENKLNIKFQLDHIIPIFAFRDYILKYNINEEFIKKIANHKLNLQILEKEKNIQKREDDFKIPIEEHFLNIEKLIYKINDYIY